ncbi:hypothetical protein PVAR5_7538 [Paecilomyces variotii No. 5]|uniref:Uncharacterized protein n=1 Tax=Byssochlamys spectabilis (strain No. 5 / NBRC 109023) TaxID=1356009 RepID=V5G9Y6_BYSSN|nr:hypothetical protein PVAR5_7538 [Paecilomyces variotii No. 5]
MNWPTSRLSLAPNRAETRTTALFVAFAQSMGLPPRPVPRAAGSSDKFDRYSGKASQRSQLIGDFTASNRPSQTLPQFGVSRKTGKARWVSRLIEGPGATRLVVKARRSKKDTGNAERRRLGLEWSARSNAESNPLRGQSTQSSITPGAIRDNLQDCLLQQRNHKSEQRQSRPEDSERLSD